ncbi:MAG TPA: DUF5335 family protein [Kofleriaceae bacterium]|nr:DUF5335 family protein [Kofleriaceae bacterium]
MPTHDIPRDDWVASLRAFSKKHDGRLVDLEIFGPELGDQVSARNLPFDGVSADLRHYGGEIIIAVGDTPEHHVVHTVSAPSHVRLKQSEDNVDEVLEIESEGITALLSIRPPAAESRIDQIPEHTA